MGWSKKDFFLTLGNLVKIDILISFNLFQTNIKKIRTETTKVLHSFNYSITDDNREKLLVLGILKN